MASVVTGVMAQGIKDVVTVPMGGSSKGDGGFSILMLIIIAIGIIGLILLFVGGTCCLGIVLIAVPVPIALVLGTHNHYKVPKIRHDEKDGVKHGN